MQDLNAIFHSQVEEKNQTLTITKEKIRHEWVNGDQVHLMQIFSNLLSNAVKYTQEGGAIHFVAEECETASTVYARYRFSSVIMEWECQMLLKIRSLMPLPEQKTL